MLVHCVVIVHDMTRDEYERRKGRLEEQLRSGIELLEAAHRAQIRALDLVWMVQAEEEAEAARAPENREPLPSPDTPPRRSTSEVVADVCAAFARLPETFTRRDVCDALGYDPDRGVLYRTLQELTRAGALHIELRGIGKNATIYRKTGVGPWLAHE